MFCTKCGNQLPEEATVCDICNTRKKEAVFCHKCAAELPANSIVCSNCDTKSRAHKSIVHWLPIGLSLIAFIFYMFGGYYYFDTTVGEHNYEMPYATALDYLSLLLAIAALIIAVVVIPRTRVALKVVNILLSGLMLYFAIDWIIYVL